MQFFVKMPLELTMRLDNIFPGKSGVETPCFLSSCPPDWFLFISFHVRIEYLRTECIALGDILPLNVINDTDALFIMMYWTLAYTRAMALS